MNCPYCGKELKWDDYYGKNLRLDYFGNPKSGFEKVGDIYRCDNEECEYQGYFYTEYDSDLKEDILVK